MLLWSPSNNLLNYPLSQLSQALQCQLWALFFFSQKRNHEKKRKKKNVLSIIYGERKKLSKFSKGTRMALWY